MPSAGEPVRLVIWDLDETFWRGTLSEGGIEPVQAHIELVRALSARGIVNSICSKNDFAPARAALEQLGIWDHFVFPRIAFAPKGAMIKDIIETAQLRTASVLFVDDNAMNLNEALHYNEGLQIAEPHVLAGLLADPRCKGKPDPGLERLARYKVLEQKQADQSAAGGDNTAFLRNSQIRVSFHYDVLEQFPRIHDLVNRTNQLNFTKNRWPEDEAAAREAARRELATVFNSHWGYVKVADRYGNYGICGFFLLRNTHAVHFLFSCRAMNMGIEQFVWNRLARPSMQIKGEVSARLDTNPDWISVVEDADIAADAPQATQRPRICVRGACDLSMMAHYLRANFDMIEEYQFPYEGWGIHRVAREIALADELENPPLKALMARLPGMPMSRFQSDIHDRSSDVYVLSFSSEIFGGLKRSRSTGAVLPMCLDQVGDKEFSDISLEALRELNKAARLTPEQWAFLQEDFESFGFIDEPQLTADLHVLFRKLTGKQVIVLQLNSTVGKGLWHRQVYGKINDIVLPVARHYGCHILDMGEFVRGTEDLVDPDDPGVHYSRTVYCRLAARIEDIAMTHLPAMAGQTDSPAAVAQGRRQPISLGATCATAFQLRLHGGENIAHVFDWLSISIDGIIKIFDADFDVFHPDHLDVRTDTAPPCVMDKITGALLRRAFPLYAGHVQPDFLLHYQGFIDSFRHLVTRFREYMATRPVTLVRQSISKEEALRLEDAVLRRFPGADVQFLYLVPPGAEFTTPHGQARGLTDDGSRFGDPAEWARVLSGEGLIGLPYRHATAQIFGVAQGAPAPDVDDALTEGQLLAAIDANPDNIGFALELAQLYEQKAMWRRCKEMALFALERAPLDEAALFMASLARWRLGELADADAADVFTALVTAGAPPAGWRREAAAACFAAGRNEEALRHIEGAVLAAPLDQRNYLAKTRYLYLSGHMAQTEMALATAMRLGSISPIYQHIRAKLLAWRGDIKGAIEAEQAVLAREPKSVQSLAHLAVLVEQTGDFQAALRCFEAARPFPAAHQERLEQSVARLNAMYRETVSGAFSF